MRRRTLLQIVLVAAALSGFSCPAGAAPDEPEFPAQFDRVTVQNLINRMDEGYNASILKGAYFDPHMEHTLPLSEGYKLLQSALQAAPVDSKKWFYLQSSAAYAALRTGPEGRKDGLEAYSTLFDHAPQAIRSGAYYPLQRAVYEYVFTLPTPLVITPSGELVGADRVLFKAFDAYLQLLKAGQEGRFEPAWAEVMSYTVFDSRYPNAINAALKDPAMPKSLAFYKLAAQVFKHADAEQALKLLQDAKAALPPQDVQQTQNIYTLLVDQAIAMQKWPLAISSQQELIARTGRGRARLAMLYLQHNNAKDYNATLAALRDPGAHEEDVTNLASILLAWGDKEPQYLRRARSDAESLLNAYLQTRRTRSAAYELVARLTLAQSYARQERLADARAILAISHLKVESGDSDAALLYRHAQRKLRELNTTPGPKPGEVTKAETTAKVEPDLQTEANSAHTSAASPQTRPAKPDTAPADGINSGTRAPASKSGTVPSRPATTKSGVVKSSSKTTSPKTTAPKTTRLNTASPKTTAPREKTPDATP